MLTAAFVWPYLAWSSGSEAEEWKPSMANKSLKAKQQHDDEPALIFLILGIAFELSLLMAERGGGGYAELVGAA